MALVISPDGLSRPCRSFKIKIKIKLKLHLNRNYMKM